MVLKNSIFLSLFLVFSFGSLFSQTTDEELAYYYYNNEEFDKANLYLERVYKVNPSSQNYKYYLKPLLRVEDYKTAEKVAKNQVKKNPRNMTYKVNLGNVYDEAGKKDKADKYYLELIDDLNKKSSIWRL